VLLFQVSNVFYYYDDCSNAEYCYAECRSAGCRYAEFHYAECRYAECRYAERHYAECHYAECHYAECCGAVTNERYLCADGFETNALLTLGFIKSLLVSAIF